MRLLSLFVAAFGMSAVVAPARAAPECDPPAPGSARVILVSADRGAAATDVSLGGRPARLAEIRLAPGAAKIGLALSSRSPMVWRIVGARDRLAFVYVDAQRPVAVEGAPPERVVFARGRDCFGALGPLRRRERVGEVERADLSDPRLASLVGRSPDRALILPTAGAFDPEGVMADEPPRAGAIATPTEGAAASLWREARRRGPLIHVDPDALATVSPAARLAPLAGYDGLAQLVEQGAIEIAGARPTGDVDPDDPVALALRAAVKDLRGVEIMVKSRGDRPSAPDIFLIREATRLPDDAPPARWLLARGVPVPAGDLSRLCLFRQMTEEPVAGGACPVRLPEGGGLGDDQIQDDPAPK